MALSAKARDGKLVVIDELRMAEGKTKLLAQALGALGIESALVVESAELEQNFARASRNLPRVVAMPAVGANVYDILRHDRLVLSKAAVQALEERLA
jgi:large subunit ribosomal protein L4